MGRLTWDETYVFDDGPECEVCEGSGIDPVDGLDCLACDGIGDADTRFDPGPLDYLPAEV